MDEKNLQKFQVCSSYRLRISQDFEEVYKGFKISILVYNFVSRKESLKTHVCGPYPTKESFKNRRCRSYPKKGIL